MRVHRHRCSINKAPSILHPLSSILALLFLLPTPSPAATWSLTTSDFQTQQVDLIGLTSEAVGVKIDNQVRSIPIASLLDLTRLGWDSEPQQKSSSFTLLLSTGDRLSGSPTSIEGETLLWSSPALGQLKLPLKEVRSILKGNTPSLDQPPPPEDTLTLANGDTVKGIVTSLADSKLTLSQQGGDPLPVPLDSIVTLNFASPGNPPAPPPGRSFRIRLKDGSLLTARDLSIQAGNATVKLPDGSSRQLMLGGVAGVEQLNGPVLFLSSLSPSEDLQRPYLGDPWPTRVDRSVTGQPLRAAGKPFSHGLGVHAYSKITYPLTDPSYTSFRTQYAIDGAGPYANVTVRILLDDKPAYEKQNITPSTGLSDPIQLPLNHAKSLTLEVDYGASNDTQDRFLWLNPALIKK